MLATEPLPADVWDEIGWTGRETISDGRHLIIYGQRTADDRIAFGGRGAPYHFGSAIRSEYDRVESVFVDLRRVLADLVPATRDARITHTWGGPLGIPRDWYPSCGYDRGVGQRVGGRVRGRRRRDDEPRRAHARRSDHGRRHVDRAPPVGAPRLTRLGTGAVPVARAPRPHGARAQRGPSRGRTGRPARRIELLEESARGLARGDEWAAAARVIACCVTSSNAIFTD